MSEPRRVSLPDPAPDAPGNTPPTTLADLAVEIRSKNAGPFWITLDAFMRDDAGYAVAEEIITADLIANLYAVPAADVLIFRIPELKIIKASFPRLTSQGSLHDRDIHAGQHHVPLARINVAHIHPPAPGHD
jgi:hypothetical protein